MLSMNCVELTQCHAYIPYVTKRWPLIIFYGLLNVGGINAYVIIKANKEHARSKMKQIERVG